MIIPIVIDINDLRQQFSVNKEQIDDLCDSIAKSLAARYAQELEQQATDALHQTRRRYIQNIRVIDSGRMEGTVLLDYSKDPLVRMIEEGASPFNIKDGLLKSAKVKIGKNGGRYITVPLRWGVPTTIGDSDAFSGIMPKPVYSVIKNKPSVIPVSGGGTRTAGLQINEIPPPFNIPKRREVIKDTQGQMLFEAYTHKSSLYQGMVKKTDRVTGQNTYNTFRRVSENSDADAFIHPGIEQYNLIQKALNSFDQQREVSNALDEGLAKIGF